MFGDNQVILARVKISILGMVAIVALTACPGKKSGSRSGDVGANPPGAPADPLPPAIEQNVDQGTVGPGANGYPPVRRAGPNARRDSLWRLAQLGLQDMRNVCARGQGGAIQQAASVTHYYIPPGAAGGYYRCKNGTGYFNQPELRGLCLHPCRTLAADPRFNRPGEVLFFPALVGLSCGTGRNRMIHDGFMVVADGGDPEAINSPGRFGLFWGRCNRESNGSCLDAGAVAIDFSLTFSSYCRAWRPQDPLHRSDLKLDIYNQVRREAIRRGDNQAADFDLDMFIGLGVRPDGLVFRRTVQ